MRRWIPVLVVVTVFALGAVVAPAYATQPTVTVDGEVTSPAAYTPAQLAALPQTTATVSEGAHQFTETGVLLETLVLDAVPAYPASLLNTKNELLRVTVTVHGAGDDAVTFALGELDANFGNHPALLALTQDGQRIAGGPELVVPGDRAPVRFVYGVDEVTVGIATAPATNTLLGSPVVVIDGQDTVSLSAAELARLPQETLAVSYLGPSGVSMHTETGPPLLDVLAIAGVAPTFDTWVAAVGDDNYVATVTPGEQLVGNRPLQLSLVEDGVALPQPRLVADGDVKGGRYDSDVVDLYVGTGAAT